MKKNLKHISLLLILIFAAQLLPSLCAAASAADGWVRESFESSDISHITAVNSKLSRNTMQTLGGSAGSLEVSVAKNSGAPSFAAEQRAGTSYEISCWIKMKETPLIDKVQFIFQASTEDDPSKKAYNTVSVDNAGLKAGQWTHVTARYVCDGFGKIVGVADRVPVTDDGTVDIRIGDGNIATTSPNGSTVDYYLEDFTVIPVMKSEDGNIVSDGDFESPGALSSWTKSSASLVSLESDTSGTYARVNGRSNLANLSQQVPVKFNTDYTISFRLKTDDAATLNSQVQMIFDRSKSKTDTAIRSYEYMRDETNMTIGAQWSEYTINYRYDYTGNDTEAYPTVYLRIGSGNSDNIGYCIDDIKITENTQSTEINKVDVTLSGEAGVGESIRADLNYSGEQEIAGYAVAVKRKTDTQLAMVYTAQTSDPYFEYQIRENDKDSYLEFSAYAVTGDGYPVAVGTAQTERIAGGASMVSFFENELWTDNDESLSAKVIINAGAEPVNAVAALAVYKSDGTLAAVDMGNIFAERGDSVECMLSAAANNGNSAGLFVFDSRTQESILPVKRLSKISEAQLIYVDPENGDDSANGSFKTPLLTVNAAKNAAAGLVKNGDVYVMLKGGTYRITEPIAFTPSSNSSENKIVFASYDGRAEISGGVLAEGWSLYDSDKDIYRAYVGTDVDFRQLYINGVRGIRARSSEGLTSAVQTDTGYICSDENLTGFAYPDELEMVYYVKWSNPRCSVDEISRSDGNTVIKMDPTGWNKVRNKGNTSVTEEYLPVYYENAYELLDQEGEWYLDRHSGYLYYKPRFFEDMSSAQVEMPVMEKLLTIRGTADNNTKNLEFRDIDFKYATWLAPTEQGYLADTQNNHQNGVTGALPDATIELSYVNNIKFDGCEFSKLGITAMKLTEGIKNCVINGNEFYDISGSAISLGVPSGDYDKYINPSDERYVVRGNIITDNYIHTTGVDYKSAASLSAAFPKDTLISNNEIFDSPYSGMHLGYGWDTHEDRGTATENFVVEKNYIHNVLNDKVYDGGAIYTIGNTSGNGYNYIRGNYIKDVKNFYGALYPDEGSQYWEFSSNVMDLSAYPLLYGAGGGSGSPTKWLHLWTDSIKNNRIVNNYSTTDYCRNEGTDNIVEDPIICDSASWTPEAQDIINASGISVETALKHKAGLQDIEAMTEYTAEAGEEIELSISAITGKGERYDYKYSDIYIESSAPEIVSVGENMKVKALTHGTAEVRVAIIEKGILRSFTMEISVE